MIGTIKEAIDAAASSERSVKILASYVTMLESELYSRKAGAVCLRLAQVAVESNEPRAVSIRVTLEHDSDIEDPTTNEQAWSVASFSRKHLSFKDRASFSGIGWASKLRHGTAFLLRYTEHGSCDWSVTTGWDINDAEGILYYSGDPSDLPPGFDARQSDAVNFAKRYTDWCNGHGLGYRIEVIDDTADVTCEDSCWGFYASDDEHFCDEIAGMLRVCLQKYPTVAHDTIEYKGEATAYHVGTIKRKLATLRAADEETHAKTATTHAPG